MKRKVLYINIVCSIICLTIAINVKAEKINSSSIEIDGSRITDNQQNMIGLLELPSIFGVTNPNGPPGSTLYFNSKPIKIYSAPSINSTVIKVLELQDDLELKEHGYEVFSVVTYQEKEGWYLIGIRNNKSNKAWVSPKDAGKFRPYEELIAQSLTYLTNEWDGIIWKIPEVNSSSGSLTKLSTRDVRITETKKVDNKLWLQIELLNPGWCTIKDPKVITKGWIPTFSSKGHPNVWFYSRGC